MNYFKDAIHIVYMVKQLKGLGKFNVIEYMQKYTLAEQGDTDFDTCYEAALSVIEGLFEYSKTKCNDDEFIETTILSDKVIVDYYLLAGEYGKCNGFTNENNPYFKSAEQEAASWFYFSYSLGWLLKGYTEPNRPFKSKLVILTYIDGEVDIIGVAIGIVGMYQFFRKKCDELRELLSSSTGNESGSVCAEFPARIFTEKEAAAA